MWSAWIGGGSSSADSEVSSNQTAPLSNHVSLNTSPSFPGRQASIFKKMEWTKQWPTFLSEFEPESLLSFIELVTISWVLAEYLLWIYGP